MADRIRANRLARGAYEAPAANNGCDISISTGGSDCTPAQLAANDLFVWQAELAQMLPGGTGLVDVEPGSNPPLYTVTVGWDEPTEVDQVQFALEFQLQTF
jgi:type IV pilus assembly protein PilV